MADPNFGKTKIELDPSGKSPVYCHHRKKHRSTRAETSAAGFFHSDIRDRTAAAHAASPSLIRVHRAPISAPSSELLVELCYWPSTRERGGLRRGPEGGAAAALGKRIGFAPETVALDRAICRALFSREEPMTPA